MLGAALNGERRRPGRPLWIGAVLGAILPWAAVTLVVQLRTPLPSSCLDAPALMGAPSGRIVYAVQDGGGVSLWTAAADLGGARRVLRYPSHAVGPSTPSANASLTPAQSPVASTSPVASPSVTPAPPPPAPAPAILAAAIAPDRASALVLVGSPPARPGALSLLQVPLAGHDPPIEVWADTHYRPGVAGAAVRWLSADTAMFRAPYAFNEPETPAILVGVVTVGASPQLVESAPAAAYDQSLASQWPETKALRQPPSQPELPARVVGGGLMAGLQSRGISRPFGPATLSEVLVGTAGRPGSRVLCGSTEASLAVGPFAPDGRLLVVQENRVATVVTTVGTLRQLRLVEGRVLDWVAAPPARPAPSPAPSPSASSS